MRKRQLVLALAACGALPFAYADTDMKLSVSAGAEYSSGDFGSTANTKVIVAPIAAKLTMGHWSFRVSAPYVRVSGPGDVTVVIEDGSGRGSGEDSGGGSNSGSGTSESCSSNSGSGSSGSGKSGSGESSSTCTVSTISTTTAIARDRTVSGLGDTSLSIGYSLEQIADSNVYVDFTGKVRLPTGDETQGIGLGATDYFAVVESGVDADAGGIYVSGGRRFLENKVGINRQSGWQAGAGGWMNLQKNAVLGAYYERRTASLIGATDPSELGAYLTLRVARAWKIELNGSKSLSNTGADFSVGMTLIWRAYDSGRR